MKYSKPVHFIISPENPEFSLESRLTWSPEDGLQASVEDHLDSMLSLHEVKHNAISRMMKFGQAFAVTPEGPSLSTDDSFRDIHAAVFFIFDTFAPDRITVDGNAPTLEDMGLSGNGTDEFGQRIIN